MNETKRNYDYYASLPYRIVLHPSPDGGYAVEIPDLPGCISQGDTVDEAMEMIEDAKRAWIDIALENDRNIPEPDSDDDYSGKFNVRLPKTLHRQLSERAKHEGVSLNQYVLYKLSSELSDDPFSGRNALLGQQPSIIRSEIQRLLSEGKLIEAYGLQRVLLDEEKTKAMDETSAGYDNLKHA